MKEIQNQKYADSAVEARELLVVELKELDLEILEIEDDNVVIVDPSHEDTSPIDESVTFSSVYAAFDYYVV